MIRLVSICTAVMLASASAWAIDETAAKRPEVINSPWLIDQAEHFAVKGVIFDQAATRDTDNFKRDISRIGAMLHFDSPYEFIGLGASRNNFQQSGWSASVESILLAGRKTNRRTAEGFTGSLAVTTNTDKIHWHGDATWNIRFTENTGAELIVNRDAVETKGALQQGILSNFLAVSIDHALTNRLTLIAMPTYRRFSDGNEQTGGRAWMIYSLFPEYGISAELKGQAYESSGNVSAPYFNPDFYERGEAGLRFRHAIGQWRVIAAADLGRERINHEIVKPTSSFTLTTQRSFTNNVTTGIQISYYQAASSGTDINATDTYAWRMGRFYLAIPFL